MILATACTPAPSPPADALQTSDHADRETVTDVSDRCGILGAGCQGTEDDGCPDVIIELEQGCDHERTRKLVGELAQRMKDEPRFTRVAVQGDPTLASCVSSAVIAAGIEERRVAAHSDKLPHVSFGVVAWDGAACR